MNALCVCTFLFIAWLTAIMCHDMMEPNIIAVLQRREAIRFLLNKQASTNAFRFDWPCTHPCDTPEQCHADCRRCDDDCNRPQEYCQSG